MEPENYLTHSAATISRTAWSQGIDGLSSRKLVERYRCSMGELSRQPDEQWDDFHFCQIMKGYPHECSI